MVEAEPSIVHIGERLGCLPRRDEGVQGAAQNRNPYSFMRSLVPDDLKVILAGNDLTGGVKPGGSTTEGGGGGQTPAVAAR